MKARLMVSRSKRVIFVRTLYGSEKFIPDEPVLIAPRLQRHCLRAGIDFVDDEDADRPDILDEEKERKEDPIDPDTREELIRAAITKIRDRGNREDFTTAGNPKMLVIAREAGLKKVGRQEIEPIYEEENETAELKRLAQEAEKKAQLTENKSVKDDPDDKDTEDR